MTKTKISIVANSKGSPPSIDCVIVRLERFLRTMGFDENLITVEQGEGCISILPGGQFRDESAHD